MGYSTGRSGFAESDLTTPPRLRMSLSAEAEKRKERLLALKKRKRGQEDSQSEPVELTDKLSLEPPSDQRSFELSKPYLQSSILDLIM
jgi:hypothetical protein